MIIVVLECWQKGIIHIVELCANIIVIMKIIVRLGRKTLNFFM
jgi:hypothetical protein